MTFATAPELRPLSDLDDAWAARASGPRLRAVRSAATRLRSSFQKSPRVLSIRTLPLRSLLYPTKYAFWGAAASPFPYVKMIHRCLLVQFAQAGATKTLLWNPTDTLAAQKTPYFQPTIEAFGETLALEVLTKTYEPLESQLAALGLAPRDVDYVAFDHFHTQDLRSLLGTTDGAHFSRFPRAKLLAPKREWEAWDDLHPVQRAWFLADGKRGVPEDRVVLTEGDLALGDGVMLLRTPGHTAGNQTLFFATDRGVWGCSENGTSADCWSPRESRIPGLARAARTQDVEVIVNANTPEWLGDQYTSMILESTLVDRVEGAPGFVQMFPSSEITHSLLSPGIRPSMEFRSVSHGHVVVPSDTVRERRAAVSPEIAFGS